MSDITTKVSDKASEHTGKASQMNPASEARKHILDIAGAMPAGSKIEGMLSLVAQRTGFTFRRVRALWHGEARIISSQEMDALRAVAQRRKAQEASARADYQDLMGRLAILEQRLAEIDAERDRERAAVGGAVAPARRSTDRPLADGRR